MISPLAFVLLILATLVGVAYSVKVVPKSLAKYTKYRRLKDIPASKTFFVAGAWAGVSAGMPYLSAMDEISFLSFASVFFFCFLLVFIRAALFDMRDIQGDAVVGRETIPIVIGKGPTQRLLVVLLVFVSLVLTFSAILGLVTMLAYWLLVIPVYCLFTLYLYHRRVIFQGVPFEVVVDLEFIIAGVLAAIWALTI
jgi:4-hydroxy-3-methylbut-2-enyl diphosphate reductase